MLEWRDWQRELTVASTVSVGVTVAVIFTAETSLLAGLPIGLKAWPVVASRKDTMGREYIMIAVGGVFRAGKRSLHEDGVVRCGRRSPRLCCPAAVLRYCAAVHVFNLDAIHVFDSAAAAMIVGLL